MKELARAENWVKGISVAVGLVSKRSINSNLVLAYADMLRDEEDKELYGESLDHWANILVVVRLVQVERGPESKS